MTTKAEQKKIEKDSHKTDLGRLFDFMELLNERPDGTVTHADLIHALHLTVGMLGDIMKEVQSNG